MKPVDQLGASELSSHTLIGHAHGAVLWPIAQKSAANRGLRLEPIRLSHRFGSKVLPARPVHSVTCVSGLDQGITARSRIDGLEIAARYLPMASVASDFYDFIAMDEKHLGILVADVTGHGLPAA